MKITARPISDFAYRLVKSQYANMLANAEKLNERYSNDSFIEVDITPTEAHFLAVDIRCTIIELEALADRIEADVAYAKESA